ncbi:MAG: hypothetical protein V1789_12305 [PVC group bacterium]
MKQVLTVVVMLAAMCSTLTALGADFNGDGYDDIAVFRPSTGLWAIRDQGRYYFGQDGDIPVPGKFVSSSHDSIAIFRPTEGLWAINGGARYYFGGEAGDIPIGACASGVGDSLWTQSGNNIYYDAGYVGIGTTEPRFNLDIYRDSSYWSYLRFTNTTTGTADGNGVLVGIDPDEDFRIHSYEANNIKFFINNDEKMRIQNDGDVGIGTTNPYEKLHVQDSSSGWYVAMFENISDNSSAKLLSLRINKNHPGTSNEYIAFYQDTGSIGAITGDGAGGVCFTGSSCDFAEYLPRLMADEDIGAGDLVGVQGGKITKDTSEVEQIKIVSTAPIVLGNSPGKEKEHLCEKVAFMGQVPARVRGKVQTGDYIVPSGLNDGIGMAIAPDKLTSDDCAQIVGSAWEASNDEGVKLVNISVGLGATAKASQQLSLAKDRKIDDLTARLEVLERMVKEGKQ